MAAGHSLKRRRTEGAAIIPIAVLLLSLSSCQTSVNNQTSLHGTWKHALVSIPKELTTDGSRCVGTFQSKKTRACLEKVSPDRKHPLILFMHGCAGLRSGSTNAITTFRSLGYAVVAPDSFVRLGRRANCSGNKMHILLLRQAEINYALEQIPNLDWADPSRLVLAGFSEGAQAVAMYSGDEIFVGYIMLGFDCTRGFGRGVSASGPVLAIQGAQDPLSKGVCSVGFRENSDSIIVPRAKHDVSGFPETVAALQKFLGAVAPVE